MSTTFIPEIGTVAVERVPITRQGLLNAPAVGTPIKALLGETVIIGTVHKQQNRAGGLELIYVLPDGQGIWDAPMACWLGAGWTFELLDSTEEEGTDA